MNEEDVVGKAYDARLMRRLSVYVRPYGWLVAAALSCLMLDGLVQLVGPLMTQRVIDVALPAHDVGMVWRSALLLALSLVVTFACQYGETILTSLLGQRVMRDLRRDIFAHVQRLPVVFFDRNPVGRLVTRVTSDVEALNELFTAGVVAGLGDLFTLLAISVLMLVVDWRLALASFGVIPFVYWASHVFRAKVRDSYRDVRSRLARINAYLQERITGMRVVQLFGREETEAKRFDELNRGHLQANLDSITYYALYFPAIEILTSIALASLIVAGAHRVELDRSRSARLRPSSNSSVDSFNRCRICRTSSTRYSRRWPPRSASFAFSTLRWPTSARVRRRPIGSPLMESRSSSRMFGSHTISAMSHAREASPRLRSGYSRA